MTTCSHTPATEITPLSEPPKCRRCKTVEVKQVDGLCKKCDDDDTDANILAVVMTCCY